MILLLLKGNIHDKLCKYMYFDKCFGRIQTVVLETDKFMKCLIIILTLRTGRPMLAMSIPTEVEGRVSFSPLVFSSYLPVSTGGK